MNRVVMFSSEVGSWAAARRVADQHGPDDITLLFADVKGDNDHPHLGEDQDNYRFLKEAAADVGGQLVWLNEGRNIWQVFKDNRFLGDARLANCSKFLKQEPARRWLDENCDPTDTIVYVGIDWSETHRLPAIQRNYQPYVAEAPLCDPPYIDRHQILGALRQRGIEPPRLYGMGFPHANCGGFCVRAGQGSFRILLREMPTRYRWHEAQEQKLREYLDADVSIMKDRSGGDSKTLTMREFRERVEQDDGQLDLWDVGGCGCFVDEGVAP